MNRLIGEVLANKNEILVNTDNFKKIKSQLLDFDLYHALNEVYIENIQKIPLSIKNVTKIFKFFQCASVFNSAAEFICYLLVLMDVRPLHFLFNLISHNT